VYDLGRLRAKRQEARKNHKAQIKETSLRVRLRGGKIRGDVN